MSRLKVKFTHEVCSMLPRYFRIIKRWVILLFILNVIILGLLLSKYLAFDVSDFTAYVKSFKHEVKAPVLNPDSIIVNSKPQYFLGHSYYSDTIKDTTSFKQHIELHGKSIETDSKDSSSTIDNGFYGIDVSFWQNKIDWLQVKKDVEPHHLSFYIIKATQGASAVDEYFDYNWKNIQSEKSIQGAYHFYSYKDCPKKQAKNYIKTVDLGQGNLRPIIDIELACTSCSDPDVSKEKLISDLKIFISEIEAHYHVKPILYTYSYFYSAYLKEDFEAYTFWMASYTSKAPKGMQIKKDTKVQVLPHVAIWQFTSHARLDGIVGNVDMSYIPAHEFDELLIK